MDTYSQKTKKSPHRTGEGDGAGDEIRTRDIYLGKVVLYQLSYSRNKKTPALTDFSGMLPSEYHWRDFVSRPSSAWDGVVPKCCGHGGVLVCHGVTEQDESRRGWLGGPTHFVGWGIMAGMEGQDLV